ncbi:hypothetical protein V8J82_13120 [Gymnodinialimonas sp. 2305UL16-5]|uniref:hypothetical protein n=1 Tax=Gymnodinialimonas mytili TaxID=3126503 RepID=UPI00309B79F3
MKDYAPFIRRYADPLWIAITVATLIVLMRVIGTSSDPVEMLARHGYDEIMRLISVKEWLNGTNGWYDTTIDRVLPPEGLSLHWSRYVDVTIGGMILALSLVMPTETAEAVTIILWPTLMMVIFAILTIKASLRYFGRIAAGIALIGLVLWETTGLTRFGPLRLDHHGVQVLLMTIMILSLIPTRDGRRAGIIGGLAAAMSLAVGLEMLLAVATGGLILMIRCVLDPERGATQLQAFGLSLSLGALVLFVGQTPPAERAIAYCDELAPPILILLASCATAALSLGFFARRVGGLAARSILAIGLGLAAAAVAYPALDTCFTGPYGNLPDELQAAISAHILEARPAAFYLGTNRVVMGNLMPSVMTTILATALWVYQTRQNIGLTSSRNAVGIMLCFAWLGMAGSFIQIRMTVLSEPIIPILMGYVAISLIALYRAKPAQTWRGLALVLGVAFSVFPGQIYDGVARLELDQLRADVGDTAADPVARVPFNHCRRGDILTSLNALEPSSIMALGNLGRPILLFTDHDILASPYHRSDLLISTILLHHDDDEADLHRVLRNTNAEYLVLCRNAFYGNGTAFVNELATGGTSDGLELLEGFDPALLVFRVNLS